MLSVVLAAILVVMWTTNNQKNAALEAKIFELQAGQERLVNDANAKLKSLNDDANNKIKQMASEANEKIQAANQPEVELLVSFRKAMISSGMVAVLKNPTGSTEVFIVELERPSTGSSRRFDLTIDSNQIKEIGEREGWAFVQGDKIHVTQPDHKSLTFQMR